MRHFVQKNYFKNNEFIAVSKKKANKQGLYHTHDFIEIVYICKGNGKQFVNDNEYDVKRGSVIFINCGETHYFYTDSNME